MLLDLANYQMCAFGIVCRNGICSGPSFWLLQVLLSDEILCLVSVACPINLFVCSGSLLVWCLPFYGIALIIVRNVGLFRYFRVSQIPNFLIAAPTYFLLIWGIYLYAKQFTTSKPTALVEHSVLANKQIFPHVVLVTFLLIYAGLIAHVQIAARLFSFQPLLYWILAHLYINTPFKRQILSYSLSFTLVGTILFMNAYPPAWDFAIHIWIDTLYLTSIEIKATAVQFQLGLN